MRMKLLVMLALNLLLVACASATPTKTSSHTWQYTDTTNGQKHYENAEYGFSLDFPKDVNASVDLRTPGRTEYHTLLPKAGYKITAEEAHSMTPVSITISKDNPSWYRPHTDIFHQSNVEEPTLQSIIINSLNWELATGFLARKTEVVVFVASPQQNGSYQLVLWGIVPTSHFETYQNKLEDIAKTVQFKI
jgi:hypothetical protein